jgi:hypothetical protein
MAIHRILCLSIAASLAQGCATAGAHTAGGRDALVAGEGAAAVPSLNPRMLGKIEGIMDFCAKLGGQTRPAGKDPAVSTAGEASEKEVAEARSTSEYRDSYDETSAELSTVPSDQAQEACRPLANDT